MQIKTTIVSCHTADSKPVKQEVNGIVTLPPLVIPALDHGAHIPIERESLSEIKYGHDLTLPDLNVLRNILFGVYLKHQPSS